MSQRDPRLSASEVAFFHAFGFVVMRGLLKPDELATMRREFDQAMAAQQAGRIFDGTTRHSATMMDEDTPFFASLIEDPRFHEPAQQLFGDVLGVCVDGNRYVGDTPWHTDSSDHHQRGIKMAIYLPPVRAASGALRVIPGSHRLFPWTADFSSAIHAQPIAGVPSVALESDPGDVIAFDLRLWHASCGGGIDRRMCTVCYYDNPTTPEGLAAIRHRGQENVEALRYAGAARTWLYSASWLANPHRSPARQRWIDRLTEVGYLGAPGLVEQPASALP